MSTNKVKVEGVYFNTSPDPVFLEGSLVGGHEYVFIDGYVRVPGHLILLDDPTDDPDAPETYRQAYEALTKKAAEREETHAHSANRKVNVTTTEESEPEAVEEPKQKEPEKKPSRSARKGKRDSSTDDVGNQ